MKNNSWKQMELLNKWVQLEHRPMLAKLRRSLPTYGSFVIVPHPDDEHFSKAQQLLYENNYLPTKAVLRRYGIKLGPLQWVVRKAGDCGPIDISPTNTVAWKASADKHMSNEAYRKMMIALKKARRTRCPAHRRRTTNDNPRKT